MEHPFWKPPKIIYLCLNLDSREKIAWFNQQQQGVLGYKNMPPPPRFSPMSVGNDVSHFHEFHMDLLISYGFHMDSIAFVETIQFGIQGRSEHRLLVANSAGEEWNGDSQFSMAFLFVYHFAFCSSVRFFVVSRSSLVFRMFFQLQKTSRWYLGSYNQLDIFGKFPSPLIQLLYIYIYIYIHSVPQEDRKVFSGCYVLKTDGKILTRHPENRRENFDRNFEEKFPDENFANMGPRQLKSNTCSYMQFWPSMGGKARK